MINLKIYSYRFQSLTPLKYQEAVGVTSLHESLTPAQGFGLEFFTTFSLVIVVLGVTDPHRTDVKGSAPLAIGLTVATGIFVTVNSLPINYYTLQILVN